MNERYTVTGMTCSACSAHVEKAAGKLPGVQKVSVNLLTETMDIEYDETILHAEDIEKAVEAGGYGAIPLADRNKKTASKATGDIQRQAKEKDDAMRQRLWLSVAFLIPLMYVAMFQMYEDWFGLPVPGFVRNTLAGHENAMTYVLVQFLLLLPILYLNRKFFQVGFRTLKNLSPNMDSLIAIGAGASVGYGLFAAFRISYGLGHGDMALVMKYHHDIYFESAGMILTLITVGKYLESRSKGKTGEAIAKLMDLSPKTALVLDASGREQEIPAEELRVGDIYLVKPGASFPADGTVLEGYSGVDESAVTGESIPVEKKAGDKVISATLNKNGFLKCRADRVGEDTTLSQIIHLVEEASAGKAPIAKIADKVAGVFVPVVIGIAILTLIGWLLAGAEVEFAVSCAIAVLVISCPCALGLATPVAIMVGTGVGAGNGILFKSGEALQRVKEVDTVVLDKTGTITSGKLRVSGVYAYTDLSVEDMLALAAALERKSEHPLGEAIVKEAEVLHVPELAVEEFQAVFGRGVEGKVQTATGVKEVIIGNRAFLDEKKIVLTAVQKDGLDQIAEEGNTPLLLAVEGRFAGCIAVADQVKAGSAAAIKRLLDMNIKVVMLTGDNKRTAEAVRSELGITEVMAEVLPADKESKIRVLQQEGRVVAMIGDGINDAPALAAADVGFAIGAGTDVAMESADIVLMKSDLRDAVTGILLGRAVIRNIKQNLFWAFFYNCIGIPVAAGLLYPAFGLKLNPMIGAAAMSLSSIFVVTNALRLRRFKAGFTKMVTSPEGQESGSVSDGPTAIIYKEERKETMKKVMTIEGMMCNHCTGRVQKALQAIEGVSSVEMSLENKAATVELAADVSDEVLTAAVVDAGYEVVGIN